MTAGVRWDMESDAQQRWAAGMRSVCAAAAMRLADEASQNAPSWTSRGRLVFDADFVAMASKHRVISVVTPVAGRLGAPDSVMSSLFEQGLSQQKAAYRMVPELHRVFAELKDAGIRAISVKGLSLAVQTTGDLTTRSVGDIDVLVSGGDAGPALQTLIRAGLTPFPAYCPSPQSPLFSRATRAKSQAPLRSGAFFVDLHWRLDPVAGGLGWSFDDLWERRKLLDLKGLEVETLSTVDAAVFSAANGTRDSWSQLRQIVDHARLLRLAPSGSGLMRAHEVSAARRWSIGEVMVRRLMGARPCEPASAVRRGDAMWALLARDDSPASRGGWGPTVSRFSNNVLTYDSPRHALRRLESHLWPVKAMAERDLGDFGDRHPSCYLALAPATTSARLWATLNGRG